MNLANVVRYFDTPILNLRGHTFRGQLLAQPTVTNQTYFLLPRRILKVAASEDVRGGDVIRTEDGEYIIQQNATSEFQGRVLYRTFRLYQVTDYVTVQVSVTHLDPILGRTVETGNDTLGPMYFVIETIGFEVENGMNSDMKTVRIIGSDLLPIGAVIDKKYRVNTVDLEGGVYLYQGVKL